VLVPSVIAIGVAVTASCGAAGTAALALVLAGTVTLLGGLLFAARSIMISMDAVDYEVRRALSLGS
jgi:hypothetical protein